MHPIYEQIQLLTYKHTIMKKVNYLFGIAAIAIAMVMSSCAKEDNPVPEPSKIQDGMELAEALQYCDIQNGVPTLNLPAGVSLVCTTELEMNAPLEIVGQEGQPATLKVSGEGRFITVSDLGFENVVIDASEMEAPLVTIGVADQAPEEWQFAGVSFDGVMVTGLKKALVASACKNYYGVIDVVNSNVQVSADVTVFDFTKGSVALNFNVKESTFWAPEATSKSFYSSQSGQKATEYDANAVQIFEFTNSTFYNLTKDKNFFAHRQSNQKWLEYDVAGNIFVNCGKKGQTIKGMNGGQGGTNPTWNISGNVFNFDGADTSEGTEGGETTGDAEEPVKESIAVVVNFADANNGDFTQSDAPQAGDPDWRK